MGDKPSENNQGPKSLSALSLGWTISVGMVLLPLVGWFLDKRFHSGHWWTLSGLFMGFAYCGYEVWKALRNIEKD